MNKISGWEAKQIIKNGELICSQVEEENGVETQDIEVYAYNGKFFAIRSWSLDSYNPVGVQLAPEEMPTHEDGEITHWPICLNL